MPTESMIIEVIFKSGSVQKGTGDAAKSVKVLEGSLKDLEMQMKKAAQTVNSQTIPGTQAHIAAMGRLSTATKAYQAALNQTQSVVSQSTRVNANMGVAMQNLNFVVRDSPYFFRDFSLGVLAIGNNLNPLIDSMIRASKESKVLGSSLGKELLKSLMGPAGVIFAFSVLVTVFQAVIFAMDKAKRGNKETEKSYRELSESVSYYTATLQELEKENKRVFDQENKKRLKEIADELDDLGTRFDKGTFFKALAEGNLELARITLENLRNSGGLVDRYEKILTLKYEEKRLQEEINAGLVTTVRLSLEQYQQINKMVQEGAGAGSLTQAFSMNQMRSFISSFEQEFNRLPLSYTSATIKIEDANGKMSQSFTMTREQLAKLNEMFKKMKDEIDLLDKLIESDRELLKLQSQLLSVMGRTNISQRERNLLLLEYVGALERMNLLEKGILSDIVAKGGKGEVFSVPGQVTESLIPKRLEEKTGEIPGDIKDIKQEMAGINMLANRVGTALYDAFLHGKMGAQEFLKSLIAIAAQMVIIEGLKVLFSGGTYSMFSFLGGARGGIVGSPLGKPKAGGGTIEGQSFMSDKLLVPINAGEMVLNRSQQANLFNMIKGNRMGGNQNINVNVTGSIRKFQKQFIIDIQNAQREVRGTRI